MSNIINVKNGCLIPNGNTKVGNCFNQLGIPRGFIIGETGVPVTAATIQAFLAAMQELTLEDKSYNRAFPVHNIMQVDPSGGEGIAFTETATGRSVMTGTSYVSMLMRWREGGMCLLLALMAQNGGSKNVGLMVYDHLGQIWATKSQTADSVEFWPADAFTPPVGIATAPGEPAKYNTQFSFDPYWMNQNLALLDFTPIGGLRAISSILGLEDVVIGQAAARALGVFKVNLKTACGTVNLHDDYAAELSDTTAFRASNRLTGNPIPITSVADDAADGGWTITLPTGNANYTATAGDILLQMGTPTDVFALVNMGFESNVLAQ